MIVVFEFQVLAPLKGIVDDWVDFPEEDVSQVAQILGLSREPFLPMPLVQQFGAVAELVGIECGVVSGVFNLESSGIEVPDWRPRHDKH